MDKYEFNIKVEQIKKLVNKGDYETAMKIADTIDWRRVRSTSLLTMVSQVYERNDEFQDAKDILLLAFERAPIGKGLLFKLTDLALREGNVPEAEAYYREFCDLSSDDPRQSLLRYLILEAKGAALDQQINSLERYCHEELDEKWLYRLAELYQSVGREEDCVRTCDRIMLMFGLGKYVDKAMELKLQFAPLTKYQMDLVENREKYEEKLQAVQEEYNNEKLRPAEDDYLDDPPVDGDGYGDCGRDDYGRGDDEYSRSHDDDSRRAGDNSREEDDNQGSDEYTQYTHERDGYDREGDTELEADFHEAEAEEDLAREVSRFEPYDEEPDVSAGGETRVFDHIRDIKELPVADCTAVALEPGSSDGKADEEEPIVEDWDLEPDEGQKETNHLMIEAEDEGTGLALALESLKKLHKELGTKNPVAKISGEKLNKRGILAVSDRLAGRDLIVERASDLEQTAIDELSELMDKDTAGMAVILIDTPDRIRQLYGNCPSLAVKFRYIGCEHLSKEDPEEMRRKLARREEEIRRQAIQDAHEVRRRQAAAEEEERHTAQIVQEEEESAASDYETEDGRWTDEETQRHQAEYEAENALRFRVEQEEEEARYQDRDGRHESDPGYAGETEPEDERGGARDSYSYGAELEDERSGAQDSYAYGAEPEDERSGAQDSYAYGAEPEDERGGAQDSYSYEEEPEDDPEQNGRSSFEPKPGGSDGNHKMDVEEFAQYACKYAAEIDCSISGKSMLALYERIEMMEEDGSVLTKAAAEELIEEAADKAEKRSFGGMFSSKYDKDGLLVLKEKHFFD